MISGRKELALYQTPLQG